MASQQTQNIVKICLDCLSESYKNIFKIKSVIDRKFPTYRDNNRLDTQATVNFIGLVFQTGERKQTHKRTDRLTFSRLPYLDNLHADKIFNIDRI